MTRVRGMNPGFGTNSLAQFDNPLLQLTLWFEVRMRSSSPEELVCQREIRILLFHTNTQEEGCVKTRVLLAVELNQ